MKNKESLKKLEVVDSKQERQETSLLLKALDSFGVSSKRWERELDFLESDDTDTDLDGDLDLEGLIDDVGKRVEEKKKDEIKKLKKTILPIEVDGNLSNISELSKERADIIEDIQKVEEGFDIENPEFSIEVQQSIEVLNHLCSENIHDRQKLYDAIYHSNQDLVPLLKYMEKNPKELITKVLPKIKNLESRLILINEYSVILTLAGVDVIALNEDVMTQAKYSNDDIKDNLLYEKREKDLLNSKNEKKKNAFIVEDCLDRIMGKIDTNIEWALSIYSASLDESVIGDGKIRLEIKKGFENKIREIINGLKDVQPFEVLKLYSLLQKNEINTDSIIGVRDLGYVTEDAFSKTTVNSENYQEIFLKFNEYSVFLEKYRSRMILENILIELSGDNLLLALSLHDREYKKTLGRDFFREIIQKRFNDELAKSPLDALKFCEELPDSTDSLEYHYSMILGLKDKKSILSLLKSNKLKDRIEKNIIRRYDLEHSILSLFVEGLESGVKSVVDFYRELPDDFNKVVISQKIVSHFWLSLDSNLPEKEKGIKTKEYFADKLDILAEMMWSKDSDNNMVWQISNAFTNGGGVVQLDMIKDIVKRDNRLTTLAKLNLGSLKMMYDRIVAEDLLSDDEFKKIYNACLKHRPQDILFFREIFKDKVDISDDDYAASLAELYKNQDEEIFFGNSH